MLPSLVPLGLGRTEYGACWRLQNAFHAQCAQGSVPDLLLLTEHEHTYTTGRRSSSHHLLLGPEELRRRGIALFQTDRGGDITYHGPGQLVGYPIVHLQPAHGGVVGYLRRLEQALIEVLGSIGVAAHLREGLTGVWTARGKIASIGVRISAGVTLHGFALNVDPDLGYFEGIVPCGIEGCVMTSVTAELGRPASVELLLGPVADAVSRQLGMRVEASRQHELFEQARAVLDSLPAVGPSPGPGASQS